MRVALVLDRGPGGTAYGAGYAAPELQVVVRSVDYRVDILLDDVAADDHYARLTVAHTSPIRSSSI